MIDRIKTLIGLGMILATCSVFYGEIILDDQNASSLVGHWTGTYDMAKYKNKAGTERSEPMELSIGDNGSAVFNRPAKGKTWESDVIIVDGKLELRMSGKGRLFTLHETDGELELVTEFDVTRSGNKRDITVTFVKSR